jgi:hypothetical protein
MPHGPILSPHLNIKSAFDFSRLFGHVLDLERDAEVLTHEDEVFGLDGEGHVLRLAQTHNLSISGLIQINKT